MVSLLCAVTFQRVNFGSLDFPEYRVDLACSEFINATLPKCGSRPLFGIYKPSPVWKHTSVLRARLTNSVELTASLSTLGKVAWVRLDDDSVRFTIIPETGTQVWA
jgi:hypothetical protein